MRIVAGRFRSRRIHQPKDRGTTRPITDRVKTSLFDRLGARGLFDGGAVADVFCGTGSLGLESLSRGSEHCTFVDRDRSAGELLKKNINELGVASECDAVSGDALAGMWLMRLATPLNVLFLDPPYRMLEADDSRRAVLAVATRAADHVASEGVLVLRSPHPLELEAIDRWDEPELYVYGGMAVRVYSRV